MTLEIAKEKEAEEIVFLFKQKFFSKFGVYPEVYYELVPNQGSKKIFYLKAFEELVNECYNSRYPDIPYPGGIRNRTRKAELVSFRMIFFKIGRERGFGPSYLANFLNFDHSSAIHGARKIATLLEIRDKETVKNYNLVKNAFRKRFSVDGDIFSYIGRESFSE